MIQLGGGQVSVVGSEILCEGRLDGKEWSIPILRDDNNCVIKNNRKNRNDRNNRNNKNNENNINYRLKHYKNSRQQAAG